MVIKTKFKERLCVYRNKGIGSVHFIKRRERIGKIHNELRNLIGECDYILLLEDDTIFPPDTLKTFLENSENIPNMGVISGIQIGRHGFTSIGAYNVDNVGIPNRITSILMDTGVKAVDATGIFCCLVKREHYVKHDFQPYGKILGPDFEFGLSLRQQGLQNYVNYNIQCGHLTKLGELTFQNTQIVQFQLNREGDNWSQGVLQ